MNDEIRAHLATGDLSELLDTAGADEEYTMDSDGQSGHWYRFGATIYCVVKNGEGSVESRVTTHGDAAEAAALLASAVQEITLLHGLAQNMGVTGELVVSHKLNGVETDTDESVSVESNPYTQMYV